MDTLFLDGTASSKPLSFFKCSAPRERCGITSVTLSDSSAMIQGRLIESKTSGVLLIHSAKWVHRPTAK